MSKSHVQSLKNLLVRASASEMQHSFCFLLGGSNKRLWKSSQHERDTWFVVMGDEGVKEEKEELCDEAKPKSCRDLIWDCFNTVFSSVAFIASNRMTFIASISTFLRSGSVKLQCVISCFFL